MDPNETYRLLTEALTKGDRESALEHANNLHEWLNKGGACPEIPNTDMRSLLIEFTQGIILECRL